jgi:hypothetical protein
LREYFCIIRSPHPFDGFSGLRLIAGLFLGLAGAAISSAQEATLRAAPEISLPTPNDGNSPAFWWDGEMRMFTSIGWPLRLSRAADQFGPWQTQRVSAREFRDRTLWVEAAWVDPDGTVFAWYHHEPGWLYEDSDLTAPKIGALVSFDGGETVHDLGYILESGDELDDDAHNGFFTGGHGDVSVVLDRERQYFYFFFTNYGGPVESQGVVTARLAYADRFEPAGRVQKYFQGGWNEPGLGGRTTPIFRAARSWHHRDPDSMWGPAVHWNSYLGCHVMLMNHAQGLPGWAQEGVYISYSTDPALPGSWSKPAKLLDATDIPTWSSFYPQVIGLEAGGTDTEAGRVARFYLNGTSSREIIFSRSGSTPPPPLDVPVEKPRDIRS